jgi:hypothetical protein
MKVSLNSDGDHIPQCVYDELTLYKDRYVEGQNDNPTLAVQVGESTLEVLRSDLDQDRENIVSMIAGICYGHDIDIDEVAGIMVQMTLLNEPKTQNKYLMLPKEAE